MISYYKVSEKRLKQLYHYYLELQYLKGYFHKNEEVKNCVAVADEYMDEFTTDIGNDPEIELLP